MTENKRFTIADGLKIVAIKDNDKIMNSKQVCNKLNDLKEARSYYQENFLTMKTERNQLKEENKTLKEEKETYKTLYEEMSYYFRDGITLRDLDHKDFYTLQRLAKGLVD